MVSADDAMAAVLDVMAGPWVWGVSDCCSAACDVFARLHGIDPMAPLRGRFASRAEALRLIRSAGGWRPMCADLAARAGLRAGIGGAGELGLVRGGGRLSLAVGVGHGMWAGRVDGGFATTAGVIWSCRS